MLSVFGRLLSIVIRSNNLIVLMNLVIDHSCSSRGHYGHIRELGQLVYHSVIALRHCKFRVPSLPRSPLSVSRCRNNSPYRTLRTYLYRRLWKVIAKPHRLKTGSSPMWQRGDW